MAYLSFGNPNDGSNLSRPLFDDTRFQYVGQGPRDLVNMPIPYRGLTFGGNGVDEFPARQLDLDGYFMTTVYKTSDGAPKSGANTYTTGYGPQLSGAVVVGIGHGSEYFDFAPDADTAPIYMVWSAMTSSIAGQDKAYNLNNAAGAITGVNPAYEPGSFDSEALTGVMGNFKAWFPLTRIQEATFAAYTPGAKVTVLNGRLKIAGVGTREIGTVERVHAKKVLININL